VTQSALIARLTQPIVNPVRLAFIFGMEIDAIARQDSISSG